MKMFEFERKFDYSKITNIVMDNVNWSDYPDFVDAYIESADYNGEPMTEAQLDDLNDDFDFRYECALESII